ncbi:MAG: transcriptional repressor [Kiritimatiellaceae bacterium]|nr:transcriptional repressor [Kiritimatiellaceae bacterium]
MRQQSEISEFLARAEAYCIQQGVRLTAGRLSILEQVAASQHPVKAYDLIAASSGGKKPMPPLIYRALDFWTAHGFIHRIESLNAYTVCTHPGCGHECQIFICSQCGRVSELCNDTAGQQVRQHAASQGFSVTQLRIEATGRCPDCR